VAANATAIWRVRPGGSNNNGGGYDPGISGAGTDYSQFNSPQASQSSTANTSTATTTLTDLGASFTSALIGNAIRVSGTGITTTYTFITAVSSGTMLTLQTSPGTAGTVVSYNVGGGWGGAAANSLTANLTATGPVVAGNTVYILGAGIPNPSSYSFDYTLTSIATLASGSTSAGLIRFAADPVTPSYNGLLSGGMPCISSTVTITLGTYNMLSLLWTVGAGAPGTIYWWQGTSGTCIYNCIADQNGYDGAGWGAAFGAIVGCEVFSSAAKRTTNANPGIYGNGTAPIALCNVHNCIGPGINTADAKAITYCVIAKNGGDGIVLVNAGANNEVQLSNNTIDGNLGHGVNITQADLFNLPAFFNNIISNHTQAGKVGVNVSSSSAVVNLKIAGVSDYNSYYNNTSDFANFGYGPHDTSNSGAAPNLISSTPYVAQSTQNYTLA
jgi:hypothetical protein